MTPIYEKISEGHVCFNHVPETKTTNHLGLPWGQVYDFDGNVITTQEASKRIEDVIGYMQL